ncbi:leucine-rich repeat-containing protein 34 isoform X1 [Kryptolebias marmoratus]|uniref:leucine-rich repeat-containing protein 34 isoform X1 n=1 Tax=Kryptolebias marmoratus TaxID=37003 RepID=UPI0007F8878A|nr:leucine-rich repeat-containing protein 34 isoform X1 [Kryptolebias marmoratus]
MANKTLSELYEAVCSEHEIKINPYILETLQKTTETGKISLNLRGNDRSRHGQRISDEDMFSLSKCLQNNPSVTGLDLRYNNVSNEGAGHLADLIEAGNCALRSLNLMFNDVQKTGAEDLAGSLKCNSSLLSLRLSGNKIGNRAAEHLARMLQINETLQELQLSDCDLVTHAPTIHRLLQPLFPLILFIPLSVFLIVLVSLQATSGVLAFITVLRNNTVLRCLDISRPLLFSQQEEWTVSFSEMLLVNGSLVELHLGKVGLTDTGMERLAEGLKQNRSLRYLDLRCNRVARDGALHLSEVLKQNPTLEIIDLSSNRIEDEGCVYLSEAITWPGCSLKELSVCRNSITSEGLLSLAQALKTNTTLTHLYIWGNHLKEPLCQAFRELISSGRLQPEHTDVSAYEVDGHVFLAEVNQSLRKQLFCADGTDALCSSFLSASSRTQRCSFKTPK